MRHVAIAIMLCRTDGILVRARGLGRADLLQLANDLEFLADGGLVFNVNLESDEVFDVLRQISETRVEAKRSFQLSIGLASGEDNNALQSMAGRHGFIISEFSARVIAQRLRTVEQVEATALVEKLVVPSELKQQMERLDVSTIILDKIPLPSETTPWEKIIDFRNDPDTRGYLQGLRVWMRNLSKLELSETEANEELDWLLSEQARFLKVHEIDSMWGAIGQVFVSSAELAEDLVKFRWGKIASGLVSLVNWKTELLKAEVESPHKEVNYIIRAQKEFGSE